MRLRLTAILFVVPLLTTNLYAQAPAKARVDSLGDPLPEGAIARLGTLRMRQVDDYGWQFSFSADGKKAFSRGHESDHVTVWDRANGKELSPLGKIEKGKLRYFVLSHDRTLLALICSKTIEIWNTNTGKKLTEFACESMAVFSFKGNDTLVGVDEVGGIEFWDIEKGKVVASRNLMAGFEKSKEAKANLVRMLDWNLSPDGRTLVAHLGEVDNSPILKHGPVERFGLVVVAWDTTTGKELWRQVGEESGHNFVFSPDSKWFVKLASWQYDAGEFICCEAATGKVIARLELRKVDPKPAVLGSSAGWQATVRPRAIAPDCKTIAIGKHDSKVVLWDMSGQQPLRELALLPSNSNASARIPLVDFSPDGKSLLATLDHHLQLIDLATGKQLLPWDGHRAAVSYLAFSADGRLLTSGSGRLPYYSTLLINDVVVWSFPAGKVLRHSETATLKTTIKVELLSNDHNVGLSIKPEGNFFIEPKTGKTLGKLNAEMKDRRLWECGFSPLGRYFVLSRAGDRLAGIFETATGTHLCQLPRNWIHESVTFSADETVFACQDRSGLTHIASTATGKLIKSLGRASSREEFFRISPFKFSFDSKYLASWDVNTDGVVVWGLSNGRQYLRLPGRDHNGAGAQVIFCWSPDGRMLAEVGAVSTDVIRIWEVASGKLRRQISGHAASIEALAFSPDGRYLASGSADTTVLIWDLWDR